MIECVLQDRKARCKVTMHLLTMRQHWHTDTGLTLTLTTRCATHRATVEATATIVAGPAGAPEAVETTAAVTVSVAEGCVHVQDFCDQSDLLLSSTTMFWADFLFKAPAVDVTVSGPALV